MPKGAIDLGPVLLLGGAEPGVVDDVLLAAEKRLGADGFVREGRSLSKVYAIDLTPNAEWRKDEFASVAADIGLFILFGRIGGGAFDSPSGTETAFYYRAYRVLDAMPPPTPIDWSRTELKPSEALAAAKTLAEQLQIVHAMLAEGQISVKTYRALREQLVASLV